MKKGFTFILSLVLCMGWTVSAMAAEPSVYQTDWGTISNSLGRADWSIDGIRKPILCVAPVEIETTREVLSFEMNTYDAWAYGEEEDDPQEFEILDKSTVVHAEHEGHEEFINAGVKMVLTEPGCYVLEISVCNSTHDDDNANIGDYTYWTVVLSVEESGTESAEEGAAFTDVPEEAYYTEAVKWAYENGVTTGTSATTFGPMDTCTRGQVVTFLWRAKGCPEPTTTVNPFADVKESDYFYKAVLWAVENGITTGTSATTFGPKDTCTSGHVVTFLWRANEKPAAVGESTLVESGKWYSDAVAWADSIGLFGGIDTVFAVGNYAPRADIVTYLFRNIGL